jgi:hypothetical protein
MPVRFWYYFVAKFGAMATYYRALTRECLCRCRSATIPKLLGELAIVRYT